MARERVTGKAASLGFWARSGTLGSPMTEDHAHADIELNYLYSGGLRYFFGGRFHEVRPGRLVAFWAAIPHQTVRVEPSTEIMWVCVPLAQFLRWDLGAAPMRSLLRGDLVVDQQGLPSDTEQFRRWSADFATGDPFDLRTMALEVEARVRRLTRAGRTSKPERGGSTGSQADHGATDRVESIALWLGAHYRDDLTMATIGAAVGLHPNYAMSLFRASCGMTIWSYVTRLRLAHAQRQLATTDRSALAIAMDAGFGSLGRFYAAFGAECGMPPGEFRRLNRG